MKRTTTQNLITMLALALFALALAGCVAEEDTSLSNDSGSSGAQPSSPGDGNSDGGGNDNTSKFVTVSWLEPNTNDDGSCLDDLGTYIISYGLSPSNYSDQVTVNANNLVCVDSSLSSSCGYYQRCTYMVDNLETASYYFAMQAVDNNGNVSGYSNEVVYTVQ